MQVICTCATHPALGTFRAASLEGSFPTEKQTPGKGATEFDVFRNAFEKI